MTSFLNKKYNINLGENFNNNWVNLGKMFSKFYINIYIFKFCKCISN